MVKDGIEFINADPGVVSDHLKSVGRENIDISPSRLKVAADGPLLYLQVFNGGIKEYPLRRSFLYKLLGWYHFPVHLVSRLSPETAAYICNDFLMNIKREFVTVKLESGDALTILSPDYNELTDLDVIKNCSALGINKISRNDFFIRITSESRMKTEPVPGDECGIGLNIINSETGFRALEVSHFVLRYVCTNGAVIKISDTNRLYHYGKEDLKLFLNEEVKRSVNQRQQIAAKLKGLTESPADKYIERLERVLGKKETAKILSGGPDELTPYDIFNLVTEAAKHHSLSRRYFLESLAGEMLMN